jgi:integrase
MNRRLHIPSYRLHKQSGQAIVTLTNTLGERRDILLGKYGTSESQAEYTRVLAEWQANGRRFPQPTALGPDLTVNELILAFWQHAERHYRRPDGTQTAEIHCLRAALRSLRQLYGHSRVKDFGPLSLIAVRQRMIESVDERTKRPWCRRTINLHTYRIRSVFKWGVEQELVPAPVLHALQAVRGLQKGRSDARESAPVKPVQEALVAAVLPYVTPPVRAMIELQRLTGMRPGEVVILRAIDLDMTGKVWLYRPGSDQEDGKHKTAWREHGRVITVGPRAQEILKPFLKTDLYAYLFSPRESMDAVWAERRKNRKTPSRAVQTRKRQPKRQPGARYRVSSYRQAVIKACHKAGIPEWHPHQLRHTRATELRRDFGLDTARAVLGHRTSAAAEIYAEVDLNKAAEVMERLG